MKQAADRRRLSATSTPPSLPAPSRRRDFPEELNEQAPLGAFCVNEGELGATLGGPFLRAPDRPAGVMLLAPVLGLIFWAGVFLLLM